MDTYSENSFICRANFVGGKKSNDPRKEAYNPTIFPSIYKINRSKTFARAERLAARNEKKLKMDNVSILHDDSFSKDKLIGYI